MSAAQHFSFARLWAMVVKEFIQLRRDRMTFAMIFGIPIMQIFPFGFMFPFRGMPMWAQWAGKILPITHFIRIARGVMLKGAGFVDLTCEIGAIAAFAAVMMFIGIKRYRQTLD